MKQKYLRIIIVVLVILIIFLISNMFITREGFYSDQINGDTIIDMNYINTNNIEFHNENSFTDNITISNFFPDNGYSNFLNLFNILSESKGYLTEEKYLERYNNSDETLHTFIFDKHKNENDVLELSDFINIQIESKCYFDELENDIFNNSEIITKNRFISWVDTKLPIMNNDIKGYIQNVYEYFIDNNDVITNPNEISSNQFFIFMFYITNYIKDDFPFYSGITTIHPIRFMLETVPINQIKAFLTQQLSRVTDVNKKTRLANTYIQKLLSFNNNNENIHVGVLFYFYLTYFFAEYIYRDFLESTFIEDLTINKISEESPPLFNELTNMLAFKTFDQNNDNILSENEFINLATFKLDTRAIFDIIDSNNDSNITRNELTAYYNNEINNFSQSEKDIAINKMNRHDVNNDNKLRFAEFALSVLEPFECSHGSNSDNDCSNIRTREGDEITIRNVCPKDPRCLGICIDDHTWTEKNKRNLGPFDSDLNVVGQLKNPDMKHLITSSRCLECVKNFGTAANLLRESNSCIID